MDDGGDDDGVLPECWLLVQWPPDRDEPTDYWLSDLPADTPLAELVRLAKSLRGLQYQLATWLGFCPLCHQLVPT